MLKSILLATAIFTSTQILAHVKPGFYLGRDNNNEICSFRVGEVWFEDNMPHPLTERLPVSEITFAGIYPAAVIWNLGHPPVVNTEAGLNRFNHDIFQQIVPTTTGATSVTLLKAEEKEEAQKPVGIIYVEDNYRHKEQSKKGTCLLTLI